MNSSGDESNPHASPSPDLTPGLALFIRTLAAEGRAVVFGPLPAASNDDPDALAALRELEARARLELSGEPPPFSGPAALWAACVFYQACRCSVCRELGPDEVRAALDLPCPVPRGPESDWSADLMFRHLPFVFRLARHLSNADPFLDELRRLASDWPLSTVGFSGLTAPRLESFLEHPVLRRLYADRIVAAEDSSRLEDVRVAELLRADLGFHRELAPRLAARLFSADNAAPGSNPS